MALEAKGTDAGSTPAASTKADRVTRTDTQRRQRSGVCVARAYRLRLRWQFQERAEQERR